MHWHRSTISRIHASGPRCHLLSSIIVRVGFDWEPLGRHGGKLGSLGAWEPGGKGKGASPCARTHSGNWVLRRSCTAGCCPRPGVSNFLIRKHRSTPVLHPVSRLFSTAAAPRLITPAVPVEVLARSEVPPAARVRGALLSSINKGWDRSKWECTSTRQSVDFVREPTRLDCPRAWRQ
jgi:hypothetical protein